MPTGLIDCIVHFFMVYGGLLIIVPCGILMRYRITMLYHIMILYSIRMSEPYHNALQYRRITAILQYDVSGRYTFSFNLTNCRWWNPTPTPQTSQTLLHLPQLHLLQVQVLRAFDLRTKMSNQTSDLPTLVQLFQRNFNSNLFTKLPPSSPHPRQTPPRNPQSPHPDDHQSTHSSNSTYFNLMHSNLQLTLLYPAQLTRHGIPTLSGVLSTSTCCTARASHQLIRQCILYFSN